MPGDYCIRAPLGAPVLLVRALDCVTAAEQAPPAPVADGLAFSGAQARPLLVEKFYRCHAAEAWKVKVRLYRVKCRDYRLTDGEGQAAKAAVA
jgi:hypothetical protein